MAAASRWSDRFLTAVPLLVAVAAGIAAAHSPAAPTGLERADTVFVVAYAAGCALLASHAKTWSWFCFAGLPALTADGNAQFAGIVALVLVALTAIYPAYGDELGACIGGLGANAMLWGTVLPTAPAVSLGTIAVLGLWFSARLDLSRAVRRTVVSSSVALVLVALGFAGAYANTAWNARSTAESGIDHLRAGFDAADAKDSATATSEFTLAAAELNQANRALDSRWSNAIRYVPVLGRNATALNTLARTGASLAETAASAVDAANLDDVTLNDGQIDLDRIEKVQQATTSVTNALDAAVVALQSTKSPWLVSPLADVVDDALDEIFEAQPAVRNVHDAATIAPLLLGRDRPQHYLLLFVTPSEARGTTGFPGNFAELEASQGRITMPRFGRLAQLQTAGVPLASRTISGPFDYVARYMRFAPAQSWHNITMSPDFPSVAQVAAQLYPQSGGANPIDGVIAVDPTALAALLELVGPVQLEGIAEPITAANAVDYLQVRQYIDLPQGRRVDLLEEIAFATFDKVTHGDLPDIARSADVLTPVIQQGHLRFFAFDPVVAPVLGRAHLDGAMTSIMGDNVAVIVNNAGGNKLDAFLKRTTSYDVQWNAGDGTVTSTLTVQLANTAPSTGLPDYIIGNSLSPAETANVPPPGTNRMWLSIYSPFRSTGATIDGTPVVPQLERELDRYVNSTDLDIGPGQSRTVVISFAGRLTPANAYRLDFTHQPQVLAEALRVRVTDTSGHLLVANTNQAGTAPVEVDNPDFKQNLTLTIKAG